jgi:hypothetical protein
MGLLQKRIAGPSALTTTTTTVLYTVPLGVTTIVKQIMLCNITAGATTVTLACKPAGVSQTSVHNFVNQLSLAANETVMISTNLVLNNNGDQIIGSAGANTSINIIINGIEES